MLFIPIKDYASERLKRSIKKAKKIKMTKQTFYKSVKYEVISSSDDRIIIVDHIDNDVYIIF